MTYFSRCPALLSPIALFAALCIGAPSATSIAHAAESNDAAVAGSLLPEGVAHRRSAHGFDETVTRLKADIAAKGIRFFDEIDQARLGADAGISIRRSTLLLFGNPPLGVQFLQSNAYAGLDWPVRMLVVQHADGNVEVAWTDFAHIRSRYGITDRDVQFSMAGEVAASIASSVER